MAKSVETLEKSFKTKAKPANPAKKKNLFSWGLLAPVLFFFILMSVLPTIWMFGLAFYDYTLTSAKKAQFIGFKNFFDFLANQQLSGAVSRTFIFLICAVLLQTFLGILIGVLFWKNDKMPGRRLALTLFFSPMVVTPIATSLFWKFILDPTLGVINYFAESLGFARFDTLTDQVLAFPTLVLVDTWMWTPFMTLMTLAALGSVPKAELEAAQVDRLPLHRLITTVIWPHAKFILGLGILLRTIDAFKTMDLAYVMTGGGPGDRTELIAVSLYRFAFKSFKLGYATAVSVFLMFIAIALTSLYLYILNARKKAEE
ncbi:MAG: carbohydrate ABC transporter permease [Candidatus Nanopelagicales bacterium]